MFHYVAELLNEEGDSLGRREFESDQIIYPGDKVEGGIVREVEEGPWREYKLTQICAIAFARESPTWSPLISLSFLARVMGWTVERLQTTDRTALVVAFAAEMEKRGESAGAADTARFLANFVCAQAPRYPAVSVGTKGEAS